MTATVNKTYDVFVSHAASDNDIAGEVAAALESSGLPTFHSGLVEPGADIGEAIWQALAESRALILIYSPEIPTHAMGMVEIGAAAAWNKPVYLLINGPSSTKLPAALSSYPAYPLNRLDDVVRAILTGFEPLTDEERDALARIYRELGTPVDQLNQSPKALRDLTTKFNRSTHKSLSDERLLSELLRMRKSGQLPRLGRRPKLPP